MKLHTPIRLSVGLVALLVAQSGWAAGTLAGTTVKNTAVLSYSVGGTPQTDIDSNEATFAVDRKVDLNVTGTTGQQNLPVAPKSTGDNTNKNLLTYLLTNEGNSDQQFEVDLKHATDLATADNFDATNCEFYIVEKSPDPQTAPDAIESIGPFNLGTSATLITLKPDGTAEIRVNCDMPDLGTGTPALADGHTSSLEVLATAVSAAGTPMTESTADSTDTAIVDTVLADTDAANTSDGGARNAKHAATQTYEITAPDLEVVKSSVVLSDPLNNTTNPKRIPGAIIEYTITITNDSDQAVTDATIKDVIQNYSATAYSETSPTADHDESTESYVAYVGNTKLDGVANTTNITHSNGTVTATGINIPAKVGTTKGQVKISFEVQIL